MKITFPGPLTFRPRERQGPWRVGFSVITGCPDKVDRGRKRDGLIRACRDHRRVIRLVGEREPHGKVGILRVSTEVFSLNLSDVEPGIMGLTGNLDLEEVDAVIEVPGQRLTPGKGVGPHIEEALGIRDARHVNGVVDVLAVPVPLPGPCVGPVDLDRGIGNGLSAGVQDLQVIILGHLVVEVYPKPRVGIVVGPAGKWSQPRVDVHAGRLPLAVSRVTSAHERRGLAVVPDKGVVIRVDSNTVFIKDTDVLSVNVEGVRVHQVPGMVELMDQAHLYVEGTVRVSRIVESRSSGWLFSKPHIMSTVLSLVSGWFVGKPPIERKGIVIDDDDSVKPHPVETALGRGEVKQRPREVHSI